VGLMSILTGGDLIKEIGATVRQVLPNPQAQAEFDLKIAELADKADQRENELLRGQIETNKVEAASSNLFVAGWRPAIGWVGATALGWTWIVAPLVNWVAALLGMDVAPPALPAEAIYPVILGMLGISASRTIEKMRGVATSVGGSILQPVKPVDPNVTQQATVAQEVQQRPQSSKTSRWVK
jgi:Holin of 3TMs, for gene-transfer release